MKRYILLACILAPALCTAQTVVYVKTTVATYRMDDMKKFQEETARQTSGQYNIPIKVTSNFPASLQLEAGAGYQTGIYTIGGFVNYAATSGHVHYGDYSGEIGINNDMKRISIGLKGAAEVARDLDLYCAVGYGFAALDIESTLRVQGVATEHEIIDFKSTGINVEPGLQWSRVYRHFVLMINAGYEMNFSNKTEYDDDLHLIDATGEPIKLDWSGLRAGVSIGYSF